MKVRYIIFAACVLFDGFITLLSTVPCLAYGPGQTGPIPVVNQNPVQLIFLQPIPDKADALDRDLGSLRLTTTLTNTLLDKSGGNYDVKLDLEVVRTCLDIRYGLGSQWEISASVPAYYFYDGFLDEFIEDVENVFGKVRKAREDEDKNSFTFSAKKNGRQFISGDENTGGFGDAVVGIKKKVLEQEGPWPMVAARAAIKIPTGSKGKGFGSGKWDSSFGLLLERDFKSLEVYINADVTFPGDAFADDGVGVNEFYSAMIGLGYHMTTNFTALCQMHYLSRPFRHSDVDVLDRRIYELVVGGHYRINKNLFVQGGLVEDILDSVDATSDVSLFLNVGIFF